MAKLPLFDWIKRLIGYKPASSNQSNNPFDLNAPILKLSHHREDIWRLADACEGCIIFGGTGSGKTSGSGKSMFKTFLLSGYGGLVLTTKPDELQQWIEYCQATGRIDDLIIFGSDHPHRFNFLKYEAERPSRGGGLTENLVRLFMTLLEAGETGESRVSDKFWDRAPRQLLRNVIDLLIMSNEPLMMDRIMGVIASAPVVVDQIADENWQATSYCWKCLSKAQERLFPEKDNSSSEAHETSDKPDPKQQHDFEIVSRYWLSEYPNDDPKTRANIVKTFTTMADGFTRGELRELFSTDLNIVPEYTHHGKIILMDLPTKQYGDTGRYAQVLMKYLWQQATERRSHPPQQDQSSTNQQTLHTKPLRPVFLAVDEAQEFIVQHDATFQATARSSRACTVYLTQNLSGLYASIDAGPASQNKVDAFLGNLQTKIFHCNGDATTNEWAERLFGKQWTYHTSANISQRPNQNNQPVSQQTIERQDHTHSTGMSQSLDSLVLPSTFTELRKGGPLNGFLVDAIIFQAGRWFQLTGKNYIKTAFSQNV